MIIIHPAVTHAFSSLSRLQRSTGLQVAAGNTYLRLVPRGQLPMPPLPTVRIEYPGPGGNAA